MKLTVNLPSRVFLDVKAERIGAEGPMGGFTLRPRHIDMASPLVPGLLWYVPDGEHREYLAVSEGMLVKLGDEVLVSVRAAARGELGTLRHKVRELSAELDTQERTARTAVARMEAGFLRRFMEFRKHG